MGGDPSWDAVESLVALSVHLGVKRRQRAPKSRERQKLLKRMKMGG